MDHLNLKNNTIADNVILESNRNLYNYYYNNNFEGTEKIIP